MAYYVKRARRALCCALVCSGGFASAGFADDVVPVVAGADSVVLEEEAPRIDPMGLDGVEPRLAYVLRRYYENALGGAENWQKVQSVRFEGTLRLPQGAFDFIAFKKKPDHCKVALFGARGQRIVMAYDGTDAWQLTGQADAVPEDMSAGEALNFIRDASTGGHLLYPTLPGKRIELLGTQRVGQETCNDVRVTLPNGQQVTYSIGVTSFTELRQMVVNAVTGEVEVTTHTRTQEVEGLLVPMQSTMTVDGEFKHEVLLHRAAVNVGVMPWMFSRPSGASVPGRDTEALQSSVRTLGAESSSFGLESDTFEASAASRFPDLDVETKQSILDDIGE